MENKKNLKTQLKVANEMKTHYQDQSEMYRDMYHKYVDLFNSAVNALVIKNMQIDHLVNVLEEINVLGEDNLATAISENGLNRHILDTLIENRNALEEDDITFADLKKEFEEDDINEDYEQVH